MEKFIVSRDDSIYEAWPDVVLTRSGRMICVFTECEHHLNRDQSRIVWVTSDDRGRTWSKKRALTEYGTDSLSFNNARLSQLSDGRIALVCDLVRRNRHSKPRYGKCEVFLWFSTDDGESWEAPQLTAAEGVVPDRIVELASGRWLLAAHNPHPSPESGTLAEYVWYSDDKGATWSEKIVLAADERYNLCEASLVEVEPNVVVAFLRENSGQGWDCFKAISKDGGETWEGVYHVPLPGCHRPTAGITREGDLMITYRFLQGGRGGFGNRTQNMFGAFLPLSEATLMIRSQQKANIFPLDHDRSPVADLGYTGWVQFDDGEFYVVNYIVDDAPKAQIRGIAFRRDEVALQGE